MLGLPSTPTPRAESLFKQWTQEARDRGQLLVVVTSWTTEEVQSENAWLMPDEPYRFEGITPHIYHLSWLFRHDDHRVEFLQYLIQRYSVRRIAVAGCEFLEAELAHLQSACPGIEVVRLDPSGLGVHLARATMVDDEMKRKIITVEVPLLPATALASAGMLLLLLPSVFWALRDRTIWPWDQAWYAQVSTDLWYWLWHSPVRWAVTMIDGLYLKPPGIVWLGQAFIGLRGPLGSVEASLLLSIILTQFALLYIVTRLLRRCFRMRL